MRVGPVITAVLIVGAGALAWSWASAPVSRSQAPMSKREMRRAGGADQVPVTVATVAQLTVPVYRDGIGTVQALNNVTVRSQVDGRLMSVEFSEGQIVKKGQVLARVDPTTYQAQHDQAVAKKAQDEATLANARLDLGRYQRLAQSNAGPKQQADQQAALVAQLEAQVKADDGAIANAKAVLDYTTIASPIDGRLGLRLVDPGNIVKAGDSTGIVTITQIKPIAVVFTLPQRDVGPVNTALARGETPVEVLEADGRSVLARGQLQTIDNQIDISTGTIRLKAVFANEDLKLWPGQFVSARVVVDTLKNAKVVPTAAVRRGPADTFVYVVGADMKATVRPVKVELQDASQAVLSAGVEVGDRVVTLGFAQLSNGRGVEIAEDGGSVAPAPARKGGERKRGGQDGGSRKRDPGQEGGQQKGQQRTNGDDNTTGTVDAPPGQRKRREPVTNDKSL